MIETKRLFLRNWKESDHEPFSKMNQDLDVMKYMPSPLTRKESDLMVQKINNHFVQYGYGLWAVELKQNQEFIGFIGLQVPSFQAHLYTMC